MQPIHWISNKKTGTEMEEELEPNNWKIEYFAHNKHKYRLLIDIAIP